MSFESTEEAEAYVLRSKYRSNALESLATGGRATPTELANDTGDPRPHVSRALSELRDVDVVELRVSEVRSVGRYYGLTEFGETVWRNIEPSVRGIEWSLEEPSGGALRTIVDLAKDEFGDALRTVGTHDQDHVTFLYTRSDVVPTYSAEAMDQILRTLIHDHPLNEVDIPNTDCKSETLHLSNFVILRVVIDNSQRISISFEETGTVSIPDFANRVIAVPEDESYRA